MGASMYTKMHSVFSIFSAPADCHQCLRDSSNMELGSPFILMLHLPFKIKIQMNPNL